MLKLIKNGTLVIAAALSIQLIALTPPTYNQKIEEIRTLVDLRIDPYSPELDRVASINQIHDLIFNSDKSSYFSKESGLVHEISLQEYRGFELEEQDIAGLVALRGHKLTWPTNYSNIIELVESSLADEQRYMEGLLDIQRSFTASYDNLRFLKPELFEASSNRVQLENLSNLRNALEANSTIKSKFASLPNIGVRTERNSVLGSGIELNFGYDWENDLQQSAILKLSHEGVYQESTFISPEALNLALHIAFVNRIGVLSGPWMTGAEFESSLQNFSALLEDAEIKQILHDKKVHNVVFNEDFRSKNNLFEDHKLTLGTTVNDMRLVIDSLFR